MVAETQNESVLVEVDEIFVEDGYVHIIDNTYALNQRGRAQVRQVTRLSQWLGTHGVRMMGAITDSNAGESESGLQFIVALVGALDEDAVMDLFLAVVGCTYEEAELYFDVFVLIDAVMYIYENNVKMKELLNRFFSTQNSE